MSDACTHQSDRFTARRVTWLEIPKTDGSKTSTHGADVANQADTLGNNFGLASIDLALFLQDSEPDTLALRQ